MRCASRSISVPRSDAEHLHLGERRLAALCGLEIYTVEAVQADIVLLRRLLAGTAVYKSVVLASPPAGKILPAPIVQSQLVSASISAQG